MYIHTYYRDALLYLCYRTKHINNTDTVNENDNYTIEYSRIQVIYKNIPAVTSALESATTVIISGSATVMIDDMRGFDSGWVSRWEGE